MTLPKTSERQLDQRGPLRLIEDVENARNAAGAKLPPMLLGVVHAAEWAVGLRVHAPVTGTCASSGVPTEGDLHRERDAVLEAEADYDRGVGHTLAWLLGHTAEPPYSPAEETGRPSPRE
jgi:hypothetical protein